MFPQKCFHSSSYSKLKQKTVIFQHMLVACSTISHNKLIISTPHSTFICSYASTFKVTIKRIKKQKSVFGCFQKFSNNDGSKHLSTGCLSVTGITHPSVWRKGVRGKENLYCYTIPWYISQQIGICSKIIFSINSTYNMPANQVSSPSSSPSILNGGKGRGAEKVLLLSLKSTGGKIRIENLSNLSLAQLKKYNCTTEFASFSIMSGIMTKLSFSYKTVFKQKKKKRFSISKIVNQKPVKLIQFC